MESEDRELLKKTLAVSEENNKMLRSIYRAQRWGRVWKITYWVAVVALAFGAYYYIQPYVDRLLEVYGGLSGQDENAGSIGDRLNALLK